MEGALFILLTTLNKQLDFEQSADIYMFAKLLYMKRPGIFRSKVRLFVQGGQEMGVEANMG